MTSTSEFSCSKCDKEYTWAELENRDFLCECGQDFWMTGTLKRSIPSRNADFCEESDIATKPVKEDQT